MKQNTAEHSESRRNAPEWRSLQALFMDAIRRRATLQRDGATTAYRLLNGAGDRLPGVTVDRFAGVLVLSLYDERALRRERSLVHALAALAGVEAIYVKRRPRSAARLSAAQTAALAPPDPVWGMPYDEVIVYENGLRFLVRPGSGLSTGLFLDMRAARERVRELAAGRTVLNLFAYTCAFGVAALAGAAETRSLPAETSPAEADPTGTVAAEADPTGTVAAEATALGFARTSAAPPKGARRVLNLDAARPALRWGEENYGLNGLAADPYDFVYGDAFDWLARFARRGEHFDLVIADPPSFSTVKGRRFVASHKYAELATACARVVAPGGLLLCCANEAALSRAAFRADCLRGIEAAGRAATILSFDGAPTVDFPTPADQESHLKVLLLVLDG